MRWIRYFVETKKQIIVYQNQVYKLFYNNNKSLKYSTRQLFNNNMRK